MLQEGCATSALHLSWCCSVVLPVRFMSLSLENLLERSIDDQQTSDEWAYLQESDHSHEPHSNGASKRPVLHANLAVASSEKAAIAPMMPTGGVTAFLGVGRRSAGQAKSLHTHHTRHPAHHQHLASQAWLPKLAGLPAEAQQSGVHRLVGVSYHSLSMGRKPQPEAEKAEFRRQLGSRASLREPIPKDPIVTNATRSRSASPAYTHWQPCSHHYNRSDCAVCWLHRGTPNWPLNSMFYFDWFVSLLDPSKLTHIKGLKMLYAYMYLIVAWVHVCTTLWTWMLTRCYYARACQHRVTCRARQQYCHVCQQRLPLSEQPCVPRILIFVTRPQCQKLVESVCEKWCLPIMFGICICKAAHFEPNSPKA